MLSGIIRHARDVEASGQTTKALGGALRLKKERENNVARS
jgi:hypothetical protein